MAAVDPAEAAATTRSPEPGPPLLLNNAPRPHGPDTGARERGHLGVGRLKNKPSLRLLLTFILLLSRLNFSQSLVFLFQVCASLLCPAVHQSCCSAVSL